MPNAGVTTLTTITTAAQQRADMVNSLFLSAAEWTANINASYQELFDLLVQKYGNDYYCALDSNGDGYQFTTTTAEKYLLPDGASGTKMPDTTTIAPAFYKLLGVDLKVGSDWITLKPFAMIERNTFATTQSVRGTNSNLKYRLVSNIAGNTPKQYLWLRPQPLAGQVVQVWYIPRLALLTSGSDSVDAVSGWEEFIVVDAAIKALQKEESDCSLLMAQKAAIIARIEAAAENRDAGSPMVVGDARRMDGWGDESGEWP